ncbi:MAG: RNase H family protein [Dehalococcoidales bacterium]|jgi:ribonuclease HI
MIILACDGGCRLTRKDRLGAWAYTIIEDGEIVASDSGIELDTTVNRCEYRALLEGLGAIGIACKGHDVRIISDSQLLIYQVTGKWKVNDITLQELKSKVLRVGGIMLHGCNVEFVWMARDNEWTARCDKMCNIAMDHYIEEHG